MIIFVPNFQKKYSTEIGGVSLGYSSVNNFVRPIPTEVGGGRAGGGGGGR